MNTAFFFFFYNLAHQSAFFDQVIIFFAVYFPYIVILLAGIFLIFYRKSWKEFFVVFVSSGLALLIATILKNLIHTERPFIALQNVQSLFTENNFAFPSGHTTFFFALAFSLFFRSKKAGYWFMLFALLIGLTRIVAGVHFPIDILGGFVLGAATPFFLRFFEKPIR